MAVSPAGFNLRLCGGYRLDRAGLVIGSDAAGQRAALPTARHMNPEFVTVIVDGALPRKTLSMGEAKEKRFYTEARRIVE